MSMDEQKLLLRFLLKRLRETKTEVYLYRAALANFSPETQAEVSRLRDYHRESGEIPARAEKEFHPFDELIEQYPEESRLLLALLEKHNPEGKPN